MTSDVASLVIAVDSTDADSAVKSLRDLAQQGKVTESALKQTGDSSQNLKRVGVEADGAARSMGLLASAAQGFVAALGVGEIIQVADRYTQLTAQIKLVTNTTQEYARAYQAVRDIARSTQADLSSTATLYARIANATRDMGASQQTVADITEAVNLSLRVSGASAAEASSAMLQLSQAFAGGVLRGEEFNSVIESSPRLIQAIAEGMGVTVGQMRSLAAEGRITAEVMAQVLPQALGKLRDEAQHVQTISGAFMNLKNEVLELVGTQAQATGFTTAVSGGLNMLANNLNTVVAVASTLVAAKVAGALAVMAKGLLDVGGAAAIASRGMAFLGGPIGVLTGIVVGGTLAWDAYRDSVDAARNVLIQIDTPIDQLIEKFKELSKLGQQAALRKLVDAVKAAEVELAEAFESLSNVPLRLRNSPALTDFRRELESLKGADIGAAELDAQVSALVESFKAADPQARAAFETIDRLGIAVIDAARKQEKLVQTQRAVEASTKSVATALDQAAIAAARAAAGLNTEKWTEYISKLEMAAATVGMTAQQVAELQAKSAGASDAQAQLAGVLVAAASAAKEMEKATATKDEKAIRGAQDTLEKLAAQEVQLRVNIRQAEAYAALLAMGLSKGSALQGSQTEAELEGLRAMEDVLARIKAIRENIANNTAPLKASNAAIKEAKKAAEDFERSRRQYLNGLHGEVSSLGDQARALERQVRLYGQAEIAVYDLTIAELEQQKAALATIDAGNEEIEILERKIDLYRQMQGSQRTLEALEADRHAWEQWSRDVEQIFQQVGQSLTDQLFEGGKNGRDLIKDLFKALTLRVVVQPIMGALQGMVTNTLGGMLGFQNPQGGGPGLLGMAQNVNTLYQATSGGMAANLGQGLSWIGNKLGSETLRAFAMGLTGSAGAPGTVAGITQLGSGFGASLGQTIGTSAAAAFGSSALSLGSGLGLSLGSTIGTSTAAMATTTFSASLGGAGAAAAGGGAAGLGAAVGAALPFVGGALAIGGMLGGLFGGRTPTTRREQRTQVDYRGGAFDVTSRDGRAPAGSDSAANQLAQTAVQAANELFRQVGLDATIDRFHAIMASSYKGDRDGVASGGALRLNGQLIEFGIQDRDNPTLGGFGGWSDAPTLPRLATDIQMSMLQAFQAASAQLPGVLADMVRGIDIRSLGAEQVESLANAMQSIVVEVNAFQVAIEALPFENLKNLSFDAAGRILQLAGGLEAMLASQQAYFAAFYSQAEQLEILESTLTKSLDEIGYSLPETTAQYRDLVESLDLTTQAGREAYVTLMQLAPQFAQLMDSAKVVAQELAKSLMQGVGRNVEIDFEWLAEALENVNTDGFVATMTEVFQRLAERFTRIVDSISSQRDAVQVARESIINAAPLTPAQILEQIRGINTLLPSDAGMVAAADVLNSTSIAASQAEQRRRALEGQYSSVSGAYNSATGSYAEAQQRAQVAQARVAQLEWDIYAPKTVPYKKLNWHELNAARNAAYGQIDAARAELVAAQQALQAASAAIAAAPDLATVQRLQAQYAESVTAAAAAQAAASEAAQRAKDEQLAYAEAIQKFARESAQSVSQLGRLREETLRYYEAQKALANLMSNSADALRQRAYDYRFGQLDTEDQFKQLQFEFGKAYSLALSTEGETLVGYADTLNRLVNPMLTAAEHMFASDAQYSSFVAQALARVENIAGRLDALAPKDYEDQSLEVLEAIDKALEELNASAKSAEQILAATVSAGSDAIVNGLRQIVNALTGKSVNAFATGGLHGGGLRLVGERGPELELTGPSRIFSAAQTRQLLSGGDSSAELIAEVRALRQEVARLQAAADATASNTGRTTRQLDRFEVDGMLVRTDADTPVQVEVV